MRRADRPGAAGVAFHTRAGFHISIALVKRAA
ncbi:hypothetical protein CT19431_MP80371 [Cupriavidus taiwanensis]|nr:hypothetical protein CT19431_MP80371 [Cupriavidus taiwanensis]